MWCRLQPDCEREGEFPGSLDSSDSKCCFTLRCECVSSLKRHHVASRYLSLALGLPNRVGVTRRAQPEECPPESREFRRMLDATDWTHEETARRLGLNRVTVSNYARGKLAPSRTVLLFMAHLTRSAVNLPGFHDASGMVRDAGSDAPPQWEQEALGFMRRMSPNQRQVILSLLVTMAAPVTYGANSSKPRDAKKGQPLSGGGKEI